MNNQSITKEESTTVAVVSRSAITRGNVEYCKTCKRRHMMLDGVPINDAISGWHDKIKQEQEKRKHCG
jgi:hypothetical protein